MTARRAALFVGPLLAAAAYAAVDAGLGLGSAAAWTAAVTALCGTWWVLEPIPIAATSLVPFAVFPLVGARSQSEVAAAYGHWLILLLLGGFVLSKAVERSGVHRRIALGMVRATGGGGRRLVLGFMLASALCSMWISNTATTLMLLPVALAVLEQSEESEALGVPLFLGIAWAASIGGLATPIGTPPNVFFVGFFAERTGHAVSFPEWMAIGVPVSATLLPLAWLYLTRGLGPGRRPNLPALGPWRPAEVRVLLVFALTAAAWIFRAAPLGGWSGLLGAEGAGDSTVALAAVVLLFLVPDGRGGRLLDWETAESIPWGLLILFGGGIAIAGAFTSSGLAAAIGDALAQAADGPPVLVIGGVCLAVTFLTEVVSNTATAALLMPLLYPAAVAAGIDPMLLLVPATLSASCAFMLPVATAPNAIVFASGRVTAQDMARRGVAFNLTAVAVVTALSLALL